MCSCSKITVFVSSFWYHLFRKEFFFHLLEQFIRRRWITFFYFLFSTGLSLEITVNLFLFWHCFVQLCKCCERKALFVAKISSIFSKKKRKVFVRNLLKSIFFINFLTMNRKKKIWFTCSLKKSAVLLAWIVLIYQRFIINFILFSYTTCSFYFVFFFNNWIYLYLICFPHRVFLASFNILTVLLKVVTKLSFCTGYVNSLVGRWQFWFSVKFSRKSWLRWNLGENLPGDFFLFSFPHFWYLIFL